MVHWLLKSIEAVAPRFFRRGVVERTALPNVRGLGGAEQKDNADLKQEETSFGWEVGKRWSNDDAKTLSEAVVVVLETKEEEKMKKPLVRRCMARSLEEGELRRNVVKPKKQKGKFTPYWKGAVNFLKTNPEEGEMGARPELVSYGETSRLNWAKAVVEVGQKKILSSRISKYSGRMLKGAHLAGAQTRGDIVAAAIESSMHVRDVNLRQRLVPDALSLGAPVSWILGTKRRWDGSEHENTEQKLRQLNYLPKQASENTIPDVALKSEQKPLLVDQTERAESRKDRNSDVIALSISWQASQRSRQFHVSNNSLLHPPEDMAARIARCTSDHIPEEAEFASDSKATIVQKPSPSALPDSPRRNEHTSDGKQPPDTQNHFIPIKLADASIKVISILETLPITLSIYQYDDTLMEYLLYDPDDAHNPDRVLETGFVAIPLASVYPFFGSLLATSLDIEKTFYKQGRRLVLYDHKACDGASSISLERKALQRTSIHPSSQRGMAAEDTQASKIVSLISKDTSEIKVASSEIMSKPGIEIDDPTEVAEPLPDHDNPRNKRSASDLLCRETSTCKFPPFESDLQSLKTALPPYSFIEALHFLYDH